MNEYVFPKRLKEARQNKGLNMAELAEKTGITASAISSYEKAEGNGKSKPKIPSVENAMKLAIALGVSIDWLCGMDLATSNSEFTEIQIAEKCLSAVEILLQVCYNSEVDLVQYNEFSKHGDYTEIKLFNTLISKFADELKSAYSLTDNSNLSDEVKKALIVAVRKKYAKELSKYVTNGYIGSQIKTSSTAHKQEKTTTATQAHNSNDDYPF